jgi:hypothetical protein
VLIVSAAEANASNTFGQVTEANPSLMLLECVSGNGPAEAHFLPLPLRPAKLRALLTQLLTENTTEQMPDTKT